MQVYFDVCHAIPSASLIFFVIQMALIKNKLRSTMSDRRLSALELLSVKNDVLASVSFEYILELEMWANAQRDGRPAEYMWRPLFNAAKFG